MFFGVGVASVLFQPDLLPGRTLAGAVNATVLHRLNVLVGACSAVLTLMLAYLAFATPRSTSRIAFWLSFVLLGVTLYATLVLFPEINGLRLEIGDFDNVLAAKEAALERFQGLHVRYSRLVQGGLIASVLILVLHVTFLVRRSDPVLLEKRKKKAEKQATKATEKEAKKKDAKKLANASEKNGARDNVEQQAVEDAKNAEQGSG